MSAIKERWSEALKLRRFRNELLVTLAFGVVILLLIPFFFNYIQSVKGTYIHDWVLRRVAAKNRSTYIFILIYSVLGCGLMTLLAYPMTLIRFLQGYCLLIGLRVCSIYFFPLEPDAAMIPLKDPIIEHLFYQHLMITKDLFFSGHVSTMALMCFVSSNRFIKIAFAFATALVGVFILEQHVHYTIDVLSGPLVAWGCNALINWRWKK